MKYTSSRTRTIIVQRNGAQIERPVFTRTSRVPNKTLEDLDTRYRMGYNIHMVEERFDQNPIKK